MLNKAKSNLDQIIKIKSNLNTKSNLKKEEEEEEGLIKIEIKICTSSFMYYSKENPQTKTLTSKL